MTTQTPSQPNRLEKALLEITHRLPPERLALLLEFARFLEFRSKTGTESETAEQIEASESRWDELFARPESERALAQMLREARAEYQTNQTAPLEFDADNNLASRA